MQTGAAELSTKPLVRHSARADDIDVFKIRCAIRDGYYPITQLAFARRFGFTVAAVRDWEQGRRKPDAAARTLLLVIAHSPDAVESALKAAGRRDLSLGPG